MTKSLRYLVQWDNDIPIQEFDNFSDATCLVEDMQSRFLAPMLLRQIISVLDREDDETWYFEDWQDINPGWNDHLGTP